MEINEKISETLNDLIQINNDRVEGYERAAKETSDEDADLRTLFTDMANDSRDFAGELRDHVNDTGNDPAEGTTAMGKIYRVWMDVKAAVTGKCRKAILDSCEFGEDAAQKAYNSALEDESLTPDLRKLIIDQQSKLKRAHDKVKQMRDAA